MSDVPARTGVPVWRDSDFMWSRDPCDDGTEGIEPGLWFPTSPEAVAEMREWIAEANPRAYLFGAEYRAGIEITLRALGFTE
jgi:hypothetical protein